MDLNFDSKRTFYKTVTFNITSTSVEDFVNQLKTRIEEEINGQKEKLNKSTLNVDSINMSHTSQSDQWGYSSDPLNEIEIRFSYDFSYEDMLSQSMVVQDKLKRKEVLQKVPEDLLKELPTVKDELRYVTDDLERASKSLAERLLASSHEDLNCVGNCLKMVSTKTYVGKDGRSRKEWAKELADVWFNYSNEPNRYSKTELLLLNIAFMLFDPVDFVYDNTHFDTCVNGRFYRMS
jgi:hypothetical protein